MPNNIYMSDPLPLVPNARRILPAVWAISASLALHGFGLSAWTIGNLSLNERFSDTENDKILDPSLIPVQMVDAPTLSQQHQSTAVSKPLGSTEFTSHDSASVRPNELAPTVEEVAIAQPQINPENALESSAVAESSATAVQANEPASVSPSAPSHSSPTSIEQVGLSPAQTPLPLPTSQPRPNTIPASLYRLPNQLTVRFEANTRGITGQSLLTWKKFGDSLNQNVKYDAQLVTSATVLFKVFEHSFKSSGVINSLGLAPLSVEEKRPNGSIIATTVESDKNRSIISSQAGFLPYDPQAHDLVSLMVQLAIFAQAQPLWQQAGTAHDFTVYRPSGIKRWRFQSFGLETIELGGKDVQTIYLRRVPVGTEPDYEDKYHFWLDLSRYGFPVKMRLVDSKNNVTDINMVDWQE